MLIQGRDKFEEAKSVLMKADEICWDTETKWQNFPNREISWDDRELMGIAFYCPLAGKGFKAAEYYFPFDHEHDMNLFSKGNNNLPWEWLNELQEIFEREITFIAHNAKYDIQVLERHGIAISRGFIADTILLSWMSDENRSHSLESLAPLIHEKKLGVELKSIAKHLKGWKKIPPEVMAMYACADVRTTYKLYNLFSLRSWSEENQALYEREERFLWVLKDIETKGIAIDLEVAKQLSAESLAKMQATLNELGYDPNKPSQLARRLFSEPPVGLGFQPSSWSLRRSADFPSQRLPNMDRRVLSRLNHPEVRRVLDYRSWLKANSTWFEGWFTRVSREDQRLHPSFKQHGTKTYRLSCENPNMQQIPRDVASNPVKKMLKATENYELWEFDYSQIEFRLGVIYAECQVLIEALKEGADVHKMTMELIGVPELRPDLGYNLQRYVGKQYNFGIIYGAGPETLREQIWKNGEVDLSLDIVTYMHKEFHQKYPEFRRIKNRTQGVAESRGYIKYWNGRMRHFDKFTADKAYNSLVQGGAGEIVKSSVLELASALPECPIINLVHDSIWLELPVESVDTYKEKIISIMEWPSEEFGLPFPVDEKRLA